MLLEASRQRDTSIAERAERLGRTAKVEFADSTLHLLIRAWGPSNAGKVKEYFEEACQRRALSSGDTHYTLLHFYIFTLLLTFTPPSHPSKWSLFGAEHFEG